MYRDYAALDSLLDSLETDIYPEPISLTHEEITDGMIEGFLVSKVLHPGMKVLDIGCGQAVALRRFREIGIDATGITLGEDAKICRAQGYAVDEFDQSFMRYSDGKFDMIWARHVIEHSFAPLLTLREYHRVLKPGGIAYIEVPAPDTCCAHETNPNHYSVLGAKMWKALFARSGFALKSECRLNVTVPRGEDLYLGFVLESPPPGSRA